MGGHLRKLRMHGPARQRRQHFRQPELLLRHRCSSMPPTSTCSQRTLSACSSSSRPTTSSWFFGSSGRHRTSIGRSEIPDQRTHAAYASLRDCLIQTVRDVHPEHGAVSAHLPSIYRFLKRFRTVISLNYDLVVYWAMTYGLDIDDQHAFKDCFVGGGAFDDDWQRFRQPIRGDRSTSLVFLCARQSGVVPKLGRARAQDPQPSGRVCWRPSFNAGKTGRSCLCS
jgi:hypothetical protein